MVTDSIFRCIQFSQLTNAPLLSRVVVSFTVNAVSVLRSLSNFQSSGDKKTSKTTFNTDQPLGEKGPDEIRG